MFSLQIHFEKNESNAAEGDETVSNLTIGAPFSLQVHFLTNVVLRACSPSNIRNKPPTSSNNTW